MSLEINSGNVDVDLKAQEFLAYAGTLKVADDIKKLVLDKNYDKLAKLLLNRLTFGTAGLRGKMGPGYAAMNDLVVVQTSQGIAAYLDELNSSKTSKKVVIGFDNRHNSKKFAELAAVSFLLKNFTVYIFSGMTPTPFVPYTVKKLGCLVGIMITASHNPKDDNGYKVYWTNGAQILPPHDKNIQEKILLNLKPWPNAFDTSLVWTSPLSYDPLSDVETMYYEEIKKALLNGESSCCSLKITFTALHGVSHSFLKKAFQKVQFNNFIAVKEQMYPDPDFPTVTFPNPEEKNCLDLSIKTADLNDSKIILANDPDADRLAVAEKLPNGKWHVFSGNELGVLLGSYLWETLPPQWKRHPDKCCMVSSTVSSKILRSMAEVEGFVFYETLTGFKWMANKGHEAMSKGMHLVFAFEEALGYMCGSTVLDKDGIQSAMHVTSMAVATYSEEKLLIDLLKECYLKYGYHVSQNSYFICQDPEAINSMFECLRSYHGEKQYPEFLKSGTLKFYVEAVRDLTTGYDSRELCEKAVLPSSSGSQMITFYFKNGCEATLRTSGTEPKVKYYTEMIAKVPESEWEAKTQLLNEMVQAMIFQWIQPENNGFLYPPA